MYEIISERTLEGLYVLFLLLFFFFPPPIALCQLQQITVFYTSQP